MNKIICVGGVTQIGKVLEHALRETEKAPVQALVFIGDAIETDQSFPGGGERQYRGACRPGQQTRERWNADLYVSGGPRSSVRNVFRLLALKSGGAYFEFNPETERAIEQLSNQLNAIARLAVGDTEALQQVNAKALGWRGKE